MLAILFCFLLTWCAKGVVVSSLYENILANAPLYHANESTHYFEYSPGIFLKLLHCDPNSGTFINILRGSPGSILGIHRHHGYVYGYTIKGHWGYYEHDKEWISKPGDLVFEEPGSVHTLYIHPDSPEDAEIFFIVHGSLEYLNDKGETLHIDDWRTMSNRYYKWCKENNIEPFDLTHPRGKAPDKIFPTKEEL